MIEREKKKNILKNVNTLVIALILTCCNFSAFAQITPDTSIQKIQTPQSSSFAPMKANVTILDEKFSEGIMPPSGGWVRNQTNPSTTWRIEPTRHHSPPYSASVWRHNGVGLMDEWLITPSLNFAEHYDPILNNKYYLEFYWFTDIYIVQNSLIYFNVSISTNNGTNWTTIWTARDQQLVQYTWTFNGMPIDVSAYRNETDVMIGFQFYSNSTEWADAQYFAFDDIVVSTENRTIFTCDAGGPYNWWWPKQQYFTPWGVRFHGTVSEGYNPNLCQWLWDFGDNNASTLPGGFAYNYYRIAKNYTVHLRVQYKDLTASDNTTVHIFLMPPPNITIELKPISFPGVQAVINNPGMINATYVNWWINVTLGPLKMHEKTVANGTIENIGSHSTVDLKSKYFFGFRLIHVEVVVNPENFQHSENHFDVFKIGPFTINLGKST